MKRYSRAFTGKNCEFESKCHDCNRWYNGSFKLVNHTACVLSKKNNTRAYGTDGTLSI